MKLCLYEHVKFPYFLWGVLWIFLPHLIQLMSKVDPKLSAVWES